MYPWMRISEEYFKQRIRGMGTPSFSCTTHRSAMASTGVLSGATTNVIVGQRPVFGVAHLGIIVVRPDDDPGQRGFEDLQPHFPLGLAKRGLLKDLAGAGEDPLLIRRQGRGLAPLPGRSGLLPWQGHRREHDQPGK